MSDSEERIETFHQYPISEKKLEGVQEGEKIRDLPAGKLFRRMMRRVPDKAFVDSNAYGEWGGNLPQHAGLQAMGMMSNYGVEAVILSVNPVDRTMRVRATLPGDPKLWGKSAERTVVLPYDDLMPPLDKLKRKLKNFRSRIRFHR